MRELSQVDVYCVHYTASSPTTTVRTVAKYQTGKSAHLPFPAIAYHLFVEQNGTVYWCNDFRRRTWGSAAPGINERAVHACYAGDYEPNSAQLHGLRSGRIFAEARIGRRLETRGHRSDWPTSCPGPTMEEWLPMI